MVIANWMRNHNIIEYLGGWDKLNNMYFKPVEFERFLKEVGSNAFTLSPKKWAESMSAIGLFVKVGRGGGTFTHKDIAFKFARSISAEFELYIIKDYKDRNKMKIQDLKVMYILRDKKYNRNVRKNRQYKNKLRRIHNKKCEIANLYDIIV